MFNSIECEKIESPKQYHSQEPVDLDAIRNRFSEAFAQYELGNEDNVIDVSKVMEIFEPHLSQHKESDAVELLKESVKLHEKYIEFLGKELMDAGAISKIAGWHLKYEKEMTEVVVKISEIKNKLDATTTNT